MKSARRRIDVNLEELDRVLDGARQAPLSEADHDKFKDTLHALVAMLVRPRNTEKTSSVVAKPEGSETERQPEDNIPPSPGHGRNGAGAFGGARKVDIKHQKLTHGDRCPECGQGNVYGQKEPKVLVRIVGQAPLEGQLGIPLPAATQWEIVEEEAQVIKPARDELIRQAAQGSVVHNDDTSMCVLMLKRDPKDERTGVFTSGIVSVDQGRKIALYFTGGRHAGENLAEVLKLRSAELPSPIQMCDALSRNVPKLSAGVEILLANCLAHGRRQFVDVAERFEDVLDQKHQPKT